MTWQVSHYLPSLAVIFTLLLEIPSKNRLMCFTPQLHIFSQYVVDIANDETGSYSASGSANQV